jgi:hypothetical protein
MEALLAKFKFVEPEGLKCGIGNKITRVCISPTCSRYSLMCSDFDCVACKDDQHVMCPFIRLKSITELLNKKAAQEKELLMEINNIENHFIDSLKTVKNKMLKQSPVEGLGVNHLKIVD